MKLNVKLGHAVFLRRKSYSDKFFVIAKFKDFPLQFNIMTSVSCDNFLCIVKEAIVMLKEAILLLDV